MIRPAQQERGEDDQQIDDNELLRRVALSDRQAFVFLVRRHLKNMTITAQRIVQSGAEADDVVQEAFLKVWLGAGQWKADGKAQFKTWLRKIVVNLCLDRLRRKTWLPWEAAGEPEDEAASAYEKLLESQKARFLRACIGKLEPKQRVAITLFYLEGLSGQETAASMRVTVGALESLLMRARKRLKKDLSKAGIEVWEDL